MNENSNNPINPAEELAQIRNTRGLSRLVGFTERQFQHINSWLDEQVSYRKIAEYCLSEWQREVPHMTIARYAKRRVTLILAADLEDSKKAAAEISKYAATGDASFSTNTLELLEQQAFDLAAVYQRDNDAADLKTLGQLTSIINKARNTTVRERHARVQEDKCKLRAEELALKREIFQARSKNNGGTISESPTSTSRDAIASTEAASANLTSTNAENPSASADPKSETKNQKSEMEVAPKRFPTPNPLPHDIYLKNCAYTEKLLAGLVDPLTGRVLDDPAPTQSTAPNAPAQNGGAL